MASYLTGLPPSQRNVARKAYRAGWDDAWQACSEAIEQSVREATEALEHEQQRVAELESALRATARDRMLELLRAVTNDKTKGDCAK